MTLRNAFEELASESTLKLLVRTLTFAKDSAQRMRVIVDGGSVTVAQGPILQSSTTANTYRAWWDPYGALVSMEKREVERHASLARGAAARQKWVVS